MNPVQRLLVLGSLALLAGATVVTPAALGRGTSKPKVALKIAPAKPTLKTPITVSFKAPKAPKGDVVWSVELQLSGSARLACTASLLKKSARARSGRTVSFTFRPRTGNVPELGDGVWCPGKGRVIVTRNVPGRNGTVTVARRDVVFTLGPGETQPGESYVPVKISVLGGSTLAATAAGRPDRSAQLTGVLRGRIPGYFKPNTDVDVQGISGSLTPLTASLAQATFPPDPLCPDTKPPGTFDVVSPSHLLLKASGEAVFDFIVNGGASQLFGCGPAGALTGTTTLPLSGKVGPKGLLELGVAGNVGGIALPAGSQGGLATSLVMNVDLSGRG